MILLPPFDANDYLLECEFEGNAYFVRMSWNSEGEFWVMGLEDYDHSVILAGVLVVPNSPLLAMFRHYNVPPGELIAVQEDMTKSGIGRMDFVAGTASLVYVESTENAPV